MIYDLGDRKVEFDTDEHFVAPSADLIGSVRVGHQVSIWFNVTVRGDNDLITLGEQSNVQDGSVLHVDDDMPLTLGKGVTIGHKVMLHGCEIGDYSLIGMNAVVLNGARIGKYCIIGAGAVVKEGMEIPDGSLVVGAPAVIKRQITEAQYAMLEASAEHYVNNAQRYRSQLKVRT
ncbi:gamma carbonic anhydrase family protein [Oceanospirillum sediminis]|uniref:Gamma carbonic anhydrase family protein n=1 Tax=Oceanospirillum sediminis TaxID=2760088 RepID=A0A839IMK0_9GAMM|nr:gamma carbonic anhydrase family protein [Oceanospirillum sediminis]